jgi:hypothetical protein
MLPAASRWKIYRVTPEKIRRILMHVFQKENGGHKPHILQALIPVRFMVGEYTAQYFLFCYDFKWMTLCHFMF